MTTKWAKHLFRKKGAAAAGRLSLAFVTAGLCVLAVEFALRAQPFIALIHHGDLGKNASRVLHHNGGKGDMFSSAEVFGNCAPPGVRKTRVLVLGDSWVEEGTFARVLGKRLSGLLGPRRCLEVVNAGWTSYSPSLYRLKARVLSVDVKPDFIIVNVDDTDFGDEWYRYRHCLVREEGRLVAVRPDVDVPALLRGLAVSGGSLWHLRRLLRNISLFRVRFPALRNHFGVSGEPWHLMSFFLSERPMRDFPAEIRYFRKMVDEMIDELTAIAGSPRRVFLTHHPHFPSLSRGPGELRYNTIASDILEAAAKAKGAAFIDAAGGMERIHGSDFRRVFKWPEDAFSHLTKEGYANFGGFVAASVAKTMAVELRAEDR